jgi:hypothetical protein
MTTGEIIALQSKTYSSLQTLLELSRLSRNSGSRNLKQDAGATDRNFALSFLYKNSPSGR